MYCLSHTGSIKTMALHSTDPKKRIVITGIGVASCFGNDPDKFYEEYGGRVWGDCWGGGGTELICRATQRLLQCNPRWKRNTTVCTNTTTHHMHTPVVRHHHTPVVHHHHTPVVRHHHTLVHTHSQAVVR